MPGNAPTESLLTQSQLYGLCWAYAVGFAVIWLTSFFLVAKYRPEEIRNVLTGGYIVRMLAIVLIVVTAAILVVAGRLSAEVTAIFSGIAGYVLGSSNREPKQPLAPPSADTSQKPEP